MRWAGEGSFDTTRSEDFVGGTFRPLWTAPKPARETTYTLTATVTDKAGTGDSASDSIDITVTPGDMPNAQPLVSATASPTTVEGGGTSTLTVTATDSDGTIASYESSGTC
ncbi:MAG: hypothetical protein OXC11_14905 [Rhodospirillales bacterium]|nr:hypothetical protein [Rhodospirillales bacterium]